MNKYELETIKQVEEMLQEVFGPQLGKIKFPEAKPLPKTKIKPEPQKIEHKGTLTITTTADDFAYDYW